MAIKTAIRDVNEEFGAIVENFAKLNIDLIRKAIDVDIIKAMMGCRRLKQFAGMWIPDVTISENSVGPKHVFKRLLMMRKAHYKVVKRALKSRRNHGK